MKNRWHICINVAYLETVECRSILLRSSRLVLANQKSFFRKQLRKLRRRKGKPISIFSHPSLTTLVEFLVNEVSLDRTSRESTIGSLNTLTQSFSVSCLNILDIIAAVLDSTLGIALIRKSE